VLMSVVSAYYYLRLVVLMYFSEVRMDALGGVRLDKEQSATTLEGSHSGLGVAALVISAITLFGLGIYPSAVLNLISHFF
jgi:NADH:ubiquinone oxidoreductase subunit 2 (subunit N)